MARTNKQATQAFIKQTLARYRKFEKTKISCFREPVFRDMFLSVSSHNDDAKDRDLSSSAADARFAPSRPSDASFTG
ncbi:ruBisCO large subunit-binding protein subunit beta, chloroplastic [Iris pallida]|uniref:RuBisCO large subunit-binding protein subunit beta, chloroplastic n=1 Tax=Iris pallida TaxID=29817 RepID=A0AAX6G864_IRIPA|nr:ruBisCO large subunit-binding protein subunit beta, chloroplastic [Iris pallida]